MSPSQISPSQQIAAVQSSPSAKQGVSVVVVVVIVVDSVVDLVIAVVDVVEVIPAVSSCLRWMYLLSYAFAVRSPLSYEVERVLGSLPLRVSCSACWACDWNDVVDI